MIRSCCISETPAGPTVSSSAGLCSDCWGALLDHFDVKTRSIGADASGSENNFSRLCCCFKLDHNELECSGAPGIFIWGYNPEVWGTEVPQKLKQFGDIVYRFWLQKLSKFETVRLIDTLIFEQCVSRWGLNDILRGGLAPQAHVWRRYCHNVSRMKAVPCRSQNHQNMFSKSRPGLENAIPAIPQGHNIKPWLPTLRGDVVLTPAFAVAVIHI